MLYLYLCKLKELKLNVNVSEYTTAHALLCAFLIYGKLCRRCPAFWTGQRQYFSHSNFNHELCSWSRHSKLYSNFSRFKIYPVCHQYFLAKMCLHISSISVTYAVCIEYGTCSSACRSSFVLTLLRQDNFPSARNAFTFRSKTKTAGSLLEYIVTI